MTIDLELEKRVGHLRDVIYRIVREQDSPIIESRIENIARHAIQNGFVWDEDDFQFMQEEHKRPLDEPEDVQPGLFATPCEKCGSSDCIGDCILEE